MGKEQRPSHISQTIKDVFKNIGQDDIFSAWHKAAGPKATKHSRPVLIRDKTLLVNVDSTTWIYQLRLKEQTLLKKLGRLLERQKIQKIRFRAGEVEVGPWHKSTRVKARPL